MEKIIQQMMIKGVRFLPGMNTSDFQSITEIYNIYFPKKLREFYSYGVPNDNDCRFPVWNDFTKSNIEKIREQIESPVRWLVEDVVKHGYWHDKWGVRPKNKYDLIQRCNEITVSSPKMIPIYAHRFMPYMANADDAPVISTVGRDSVFYGANLKHYLLNEFSGSFVYKKPDIIIPLWSDIIEQI